MADSTISIGFKIDDKAGGLKQLTVDAEALRRAMRGAVVETQGLRAPLVNVAAFSASFDAVTGFVSDLTKACRDLSAAYAVQEEAERKIAVVMQQRMSATEAEIQAIKDLCSAQQNLGVIGDEVQLAGAQQIATFLRQRESLETLIPAMNDLAAQQRGLNASQGDMVGIANLMGKAMQGQTSALRRVGITFSEAQEQVMKMGTEEERAAMLAEIITDNVGHMNSALAATDGGRLKQIENWLGDIKEQLGAGVKNLMPWLTGFNQLVMMGGNLAKFGNGIKAVYLEIAAMNSAIIKAVRSMTLLQGVMAAGVIGAASLAVWGLVKAVESFNSATSEAAERTRMLNGIRTEAAGKVAEEKTQIELLVSAARNERLSLEERRTAIGKLNSIIPDYNAQLDKTGKKYTENKAALDDYLKSLQRQYELEGAKGMLADLGRQKAEARLARDAAQKAHAEAKERYEKTYGGTKGPAAIAAMGPGMSDVRHAEGVKVDDAWREVVATTRTLNGLIEKSNAVMRSYGPGLQAQAAASAAKKTPEATATGGGGSIPKITPEVEPPEGSIADLRQQISDIEARISLTVDPKAAGALMRQKAEIEKRLGDLELGMKVAAGWQAEIPQLTEARMPKWRIELDTADLAGQLRQLPASVRRATQQAQPLLASMTSAFGSLGGAMQSMGNSWAGFAGNVLQGIAQILPQLASLIGGNFAAAMATGTLEATKVGFPANIAAIASIIATITSVMASVPKFAGIAYGTTLGIFGEYSGARTNPEVVAPLDRLRSLIGDTGGGGMEVADVRIDGTKLHLLLRKTNRLRSRT